MKQHYTARVGQTTWKRSDDQHCRPCAFWCCVAHTHNTHTHTHTHTAAFLVLKVHKQRQHKHKQQHFTRGRAWTLSSSRVRLTVDDHAQGPYAMHFSRVV